MKHAALIVVALAVVSPAFAQEESTMSVTEVPAAAMTAAQGAAPGVTFSSAAMDDDEGTQTYELSGQDASGKHIEVDVLADGTVEEVEQQIDIADLPAAVKATWDAEMAGVTPTMIEKSTRPDNTIVYEFEGERDGQAFDAEINEDGSNYTMADDAAA